MSPHAAIAEENQPGQSVQPSMLQMQQLMAYVPTAIAMMDTNLHYLVVSHQWQEWFHPNRIGWPDQSLPPDLEALSPALATSVLDRVHQCLAMAGSFQFETQVTGLAANTVTYQWQIAPWYTDDQQMGGVIVSVDRQLEPVPLVAGDDPGDDGQDGLMQARQRLEFMVEQMPIAVVEWDQTLHITAWNAAATALFGYTDVEAIGQSISILIPQQERENVETVTDGLLQVDQPTQNFVYHINDNMTKEGQVITCEWHNTRLVDAHGECLGVVSIAIDISDRKQAEAQLKEQEQFLRSIYDGVDCSIFVVDVTENGDFLYNSYNHMAERWTGKTSADIKGQTPEDRFGEVEGATVRAAFQRCVDQRHSFTEEEHLTFGDREVWLMTTFNPLFDANGRVYRLVGTFFDITNLKQTQAALQSTLQESEYQSQLLRTVLDASPDWIFAKDQDLRYIFANQSFAQGRGTTVDAIVGKTDLDLAGEDEQSASQLADDISHYRRDDLKALAGEEVNNAFDPATLADGSVRIFDTHKMPMRDADGHIFAMLAVCRDLTERHHAEVAVRESELQLKQKAAELECTLNELRRAQGQLVQHEKMSSLGQLVAGVAHEINNPVNFIYGNLAHADGYIQDLLDLVNVYQEHYPQPVPAVVAKAEEIDVEFLIDDLPKLLASMKVGADRIQKIVASLRTFSRMDEAEKKAVNIHDGIDSTLMILQHRLKARDDRAAIAIQQEYGDLPLVECYAGQLNQVFMNILSNAIDALEEAMQAASPQTSDFKPVITIRTQVTAQDAIEIAIADNGPGIPAQVQSRLFDPFFTTKPVGKGTGMGLSISYQIVTERHRGRLCCQSEPGQGTEFRVQIPLTQTAIAQSSIGS